MSDRRRPAFVLDRRQVRLAVVVLLWLAALAAATARIWLMVSDPSLPGEPWQTSDGQFEDFRDIIWTPGRYLLAGGNPYDPVPYLAAHPWAQQFSPYPPVWLLLGVVFAPLPFLVSAVAFQVLSLVAAVVMLRVVARWALPRFVDLAVPLGLLWINVWFPGRGALASLGSIICVLGAALVLRSVTRPGDRAVTVHYSARRSPGRVRQRSAVDVSGAVGIALVLLKPHYGVLLVIVALVGGRVREVWRGILGMIIVCLPLLIVVSTAAGGPVAFAQSLVRNVVYVNGPNTSAGLASPFQRRLDVLGLVAQYGVQPPGWLLLLPPLLAIAITIVVVRRTRNAFWVASVVCSAVLLGFFHPWYDLLLMIIPLALGIGMAIDRRLPGIPGRLALISTTLVVLHLHTVSKLLIPGLTVRGADTIDLLLVFATLCLAVWGCLREGPRARSQSGDGGQPRVAPSVAPNADSRSVSPPQRM